MKKYLILILVLNIFSNNAYGQQSSVRQGLNIPDPNTLTTLGNQRASEIIPNYPTPNMYSSGNVQIVDERNYSGSLLNSNAEQLKDYTKTKSDALKLINQNNNNSASRFESNIPSFGTYHLNYNQRIVFNTCSNLIDTYSKNGSFKQTLGQNEIFIKSILSDFYRANGGFQNFSTETKTAFIKLYDSYVLELEKVDFKTIIPNVFKNDGMNLSDRFAICANTLKIRLDGVNNLNQIKQKKIAQLHDVIFEYLNNNKDKKVKIKEIEVLKAYINNVYFNSLLAQQIKNKNPDFSIEYYLNHIKLIEAQSNGSFYRNRIDTNDKSAFACYIEDTLPTVKNYIRIDAYPEKMIEKEIPGSVDLRFEIDEFGTIKKLEALNPTHPELATKAFLNNFMAVKFWAGMSNCVPIAGETKLTLKFSVN